MLSDPSVHCPHLFTLAHVRLSAANVKRNNDLFCLIYSGFCSCENLAPEWLSQSFVRSQGYRQQERKTEAWSKQSLPIFNLITGSCLPWSNWGYGSGAAHLLLLTDFCSPTLLQLPLGTMSLSIFSVTCLPAHPTYPLLSPLDLSEPESSSPDWVDFSSSLSWEGFKLSYLVVDGEDTVKKALIPFLLIASYWTSLASVHKGVKWVVESPYLIRCLIKWVKGLNELITWTIYYSTQYQVSSLFKYSMLVSWRSLEQSHVF